MRTLDARLTHIGAATLLLELGGLRILTDPVLDRAGAHYRLSNPPLPGFSSEKTAGPAVAADDLGPIDAVLLSHDHHFDNLDDAGRCLLPGAGSVITTRAGAARLGGNAIGLRAGEKHRLGVGEGALEITAMPAHHGPPPLAWIAGPVIGFLLRWDGGERPWWISGDTRWFGGLRSALVSEGPIGVAIVHLGAARFWPTGPARYTMDAREAATAVREIDAQTVVPIHYEGWTHFKQGKPAVEDAFERAGVAARVRWLEPGQPADVGR
jgi:L-ascorbate metabolism protein UlaG (beta-lactamase superfamily)